MALPPSMVKWAFAHTDSNELKNTTVSPEKTAYLKQVMSSLDPIEQAKKLIEVYIDPTADLSARGEALEEMLDLVEDIDLAADLLVLGGLKPLVDMLDGDVPSLRRLSAQIFQAASQNNPRVQAQLGDLALMPKLIAIVNKDDDDVLRLKALGALSALVRSNPSARRPFVEYGGWNCLLNSLNEPKLVHRGLFFLRSMVTGDLESVRAAGEEEHVMASVVSLLKTDEDEERVGWAQDIVKELQK